MAGSRCNPGTYTTEVTDLTSLNRDCYTYLLKWYFWLFYSFKIFCFQSIIGHSTMWTLMTVPVDNRDCKTIVKEFDSAVWHLIFPLHMDNKYNLYK